MKNKIHEMYLDYFNNFLSVERFSNYYNLSMLDAFRVIEIGKKINSKFDRHEYIDEKGQRI